MRGGVHGQLFTLSNGANTRPITQGILQKSSSEVAFRSFADIPTDIYYWVLPESFRGDKVTVLPFLFSGSEENLIGRFSLCTCCIVFVSGHLSKTLLLAKLCTVCDFSTY